MNPISYKKLGELLEEYKEKNVENKYKPVAVGKYGIRKREDIYKKELAKDYSKNKLIYKNTLTIGMGSKQIDIGILSDDVIYSVSSAYHTFKISGVDANYLRYCLESRNADMSERYMIESARQGKSVDIKRLLQYEIPIYSESDTKEILYNLQKIEQIIKNIDEQKYKMEMLIKARFVEIFGDPRINPLGYDTKELGKTCTVITGNTPSRKVPEYYGDYMEWIKTDNIVSGVLNPTEAAECLSESGVNEGRCVDENAILMACIAGSIASIGRVCVTDRRVAFNQQINAVVPGEYNTLFLYILLQISKDYLVEDINMALKGILSKSKLEEKVFIVPPMELQNQFAEFVKQVDKSKVAVEEISKRIEVLKASVMQKYFC